jgi:eukaryotic-like serine/threonine-protein kinase
MTTASADTLAPGVEIAPGYEVIAHLRRGNDLDVYDVWSRERYARAIVKTARPDRAGDESLRRALLREGVLLARFSHPHIVRAYEAVETPAAVVLETLTGQTLGHLIDTAELVETADLAQLGIQLGSALHYLHANGYLHLDVKPSNVIAEGPRAKLIDLSLARPPGPAHAGIGTWDYLSPEQARGGELTAAADVWGLGATLFEAATGEAPFDDDPDAEADEPDRYPQLERRARRVRALAPVDPAIAELIDACLEPDPADRPSVEPLLLELERRA